MLERSRHAFLHEIQRAELLGVDALVFHPGAHLEATKAEGLRTLAESLRLALEEVPDGKVRLVLENSAGQGTTLCSTFEELAEVLRAVGAPTRLGVLLDTCHLFAAGFDFRTVEGYGALVARVDGTFGPDAIRGFHLNDAKAPVGSHLDRHENIGRGEIGVDGFRHFVNDRRWASVPGYLETPLDERGYAAVRRGPCDAPRAGRPRRKTRCAASRRRSGRSARLNGQIARPSSARHS